MLLLSLGLKWEQGPKQGLLLVLLSLGLNWEQGPKQGLLLVLLSLGLKWEQGPKQGLLLVLLNLVIFSFRVTFVIGDCHYHSYYKGDKGHLSFFLVIILGSMHRVVVGSIGSWYFLSY